MSDLSEQEDDRYKCSRCGNVIHHKNKMDLYTFNSWCGRCGSDNGRHINYEGRRMTREEKEQTGKYVLQMARLLEDGCDQQEILLKAVHIIDEALEQEPILDKIKQIVDRPIGNNAEEKAYNYMMIVTDIKEIIDKYKAESEGI